MLAATDMDANINSSQKKFARVLWLRRDSQQLVLIISQVHLLPSTDSAWLTFLIMEY